MTESTSTFSQREGFAPQEPLKVQDYLPGWVREAVTNEIRGLVPRLDLYPLLRPHIWKVLGYEPPGNPIGGPFKYYIPHTLKQCVWYQFYDIIEEIATLIKQKLEPKDLQEFSGRINAILAKDGVPWKLEQCKVARNFNPQITEQVKKVSILLNDPKFRGPDEQFAKAVGHLNKRPDPDPENCVKDAVGALEAVANILVGTSNEQLNELLKKEPIRSVVPPTIRLSIDKIYAYRGAAPGAGHGLVGGSVVGVAEATWVLATSATTILYLTTKLT